MSRRSVLALTVWLAVAPLPRAFAQAPAGQDEDPHGMSAMRNETLADEQARSHFRIGQTLYAEGRFLDAAGEFERAYALSQRPVLLFNAYLAARDGGALARAIENLDRYLREAPDAEDADVLQRRLRAMRATLAEQEAATAEERQRLAAERQRLEAEAERQRQRAQDAESRANRSPVPFIVGGAGLAMLAGSGVAAILAGGRIDDLEALCPDGFCPEGVDIGDERARVRRPAVTTDVLLGVGLATLVTGVVLLVRDGRGDERAATAPVVDATCGQGGCAVRFGMRF